AGLLVPFFPRSPRPANRLAGILKPPRALAPCRFHRGEHEGENILLREAVGAQPRGRMGSRAATLINPVLSGGAMSFLPRCLRIGYVLTLSIVVLLLVWPDKSRGQFRRNMMPPPPPRFVPPVNTFTPITFGAVGFGSFNFIGGFSGFS